VPGAHERRDELRLDVHAAHPLAAAAGGGLDHHRQSDRVRFADQPRIGLIVAEVARHARDSGARGERLGNDLRSHRRDALRGRTNEDEVRTCARLRQFRLLGEKP